MPMPPQNNLARPQTLFRMPSPASLPARLAGAFCALALCLAAPQLHAQQILRAPTEETLAMSV